MDNKSGYNKKLKGLARGLRKHSTKGEVILWDNLLKGRKFHDLQFNRQFPIGNYIVDFVCRSKKLAIEVDGYSHHDNFEKDKEKDKFLTNAGYKVIRIDDQMIFCDFSNVIRELESYL
ncbi:MAG: endonuclease domain-containing protein [Bacteroidales bacterium]|nr:endonuclease domain-containing protein [Bacteroidales bacterium]MBN2821416.1 endonuclease domain-containing protein [Bacteroidales bacterium]